MRYCAERLQMSGVQDAESDLSPWNFSLGKRVFDFVVATVGLILALLPMAMIAVAIKIWQPGPVMFRQHRVGKNGKLFPIVKFRTMVHRSDADPGAGVTRRGDTRVTSLGCWLRKSKLDELPQLYNVLRGQMSLVGPRPDLPEFYEGLMPEHRLILVLPPGITGWASLRFRDEEGFLASIPEQQLIGYYVNTLFPEKARLALDYARRATFWSDLGIIVRTVIGP
jgi:lipopolysaccharide/colanic/teichoic acid biosynthesis glycosyltransferase